MKSVLPFLLLGLFVSCVQQVGTTSKKAENLKNNCEISAEAVALSDPQSIAEMTDFINALPKPLNQDCLIKSLKRPLYVNATSSRLSVQPAIDPKTPRIFIFKGNLIVSLVPGGEGSKTLEFSEIINSTKTIKADIALPVLKKLKHSDPYARVLTTNQTSCSGCHNAEQLEFLVDGVPVFSSNGFQPDASRDVSVSHLKRELYLCRFNNDSSSRCLVFDAILSYGEVIGKEFPATMPTFLSTFGN